MGSDLTLLQPLHFTPQILATISHHETGGAVLEVNSHITVHEVAKWNLLHA